jgi:hypothetical protein
MIDLINKHVGYFIRPANQPMLWIDCLIARFKPGFTTSAALNSVYSFGLVILATWGTTLQPHSVSIAISLHVAVLYLLIAIETEAVWKGVLLASGRAALIYSRTSAHDRMPPSPKSLFLAVGGFGCTILCFASLAFFLHVSKLAGYSGVKCASGLNVTCWWEFFYFSATTITTIGLSDIRPISPLSQGLALLELALGLFFVVFVFATFISLQAMPKKPV